MTSYRVEHLPERGLMPVVRHFGADRAKALAAARKISSSDTFVTAYVIRSEDGEDTGQRVYWRGCQDYDEGEF